jgi:hypothetical protein
LKIAKNHSSKTVFDASHLGTSGMFGHFAEDSTPVLPSNPLSEFSDLLTVVIS